MPSLASHLQHYSCLPPPPCPSSSGHVTVLLGPRDAVGLPPAASLVKGNFSSPILGRQRGHLAGWLLRTDLAVRWLSRSWRTWRCRRDSRTNKSLRVIGENGAGPRGLLSMKRGGFHTPRPARFTKNPGSPGLRRQPRGEVARRGKIRFRSGTPGSVFARLLISANRPLEKSAPAPPLGTHPLCARARGDCECHRRRAMACPSHGHAVG